MERTRKSLHGMLVAGTLIAPLTALAAEFTLQDNAAIPAPFSGSSSIPGPVNRAPLGEPTFITQETAAQRKDGPVYVRKAGQWIRVDGEKDRPIMKPQLGKPTFITQETAAQRNDGPTYDRVDGRWVRTDIRKSYEKPNVDASEGQRTRNDG